ncbi:MAG: hypothetical protein R2706_18300 [Acidimicrobiales bacterium]
MASIWPKGPRLTHAEADVVAARFAVGFNAVRFTSSTAVSEGLYPASASTTQQMDAGQLGPPDYFVAHWRQRGIYVMFSSSGAYFDPSTDADGSFR